MKKTFTILFVILLTSLHSFSHNITSCNCWQNRDTTWRVVPFDGFGASGGPGLAPDYRNDDWSTVQLALPFSFCYYGTQIDTFYINNNGNISFGAPYSTFTADSFPSINFNMIAPMWNDVDTRDTLSGIVYYKVFPHYMVIQWDHVGYYSVHSDLTNTFQLIISDGTASPLPELKNVGFCYKDMQWTTGDASNGVGGFGGSPATVGVNYGDGVNYIQIGLYDAASLQYDGPYGSHDGVYSLSNQSFAFNVCVNNFNVPPILSGQYVCDTVILCLGDSFTYNANFIAPEQAQTTTVTVNPHGITGANIQTTPGNQASVAVSFLATTPGIQSLDIIGTDNGTPPASTTYSINFNVQNCGVGINEVDENQFTVSPVPFHDELYLNFQNAICEIMISDISGRVIFAGKYRNETILKTSDWKNGFYFISMKSENSTRNYKIIKN